MFILQPSFASSTSSISRDQAPSYDLLRELMSLNIGFYSGFAIVASWDEQGEHCHVLHIFQKYFNKNNDDCEKM